MKNYRLWILGTIAVVMLVVTGVLVVQRLTRAPDTAFLVQAAASKAG